MTQKTHCDLPRGVMPALPTPFDERLELKLDAYEPLIDHLIGAGMDGLYLLGTTGECHYLEPAEREAVAERVIELVADRVPVVVHVGAGTTRVALRLARHAERCGATAIASMPPYFFPVSRAEIFDYYRDLAAGVNLPVMAYHLPNITGVDLSSDELIHLAQIDGIEAIKFTSPTIYQIMLIKAACPNVRIYNGVDEMLLGGLAMGADGGIGSFYNVAPDLPIRIQQSLAEGETADAYQTQHRLLSLIHMANPRAGFQASKILLKHLGFDLGGYRPPRQPLDSQKIDDLLAGFDQWRTPEISQRTSTP